MAYLSHKFPCHFCVIKALLKYETQVIDHIQTVLTQSWEELLRNALAF